MSEAPGTNAAFVAEHVRRVEPLFTAVELASWEASTTGTDEANERAAQLRAELMRVYASRADFEAVRAFDQAPPADPVLARQIRLLHLTYAQGQQDDSTIATLSALEKDIQSIFVNFRGVYQGKPISDNELVAILNTERDSTKLREAWEAGKQIGQQARDRVLEVVALRNQAAQRMGYADYYKQSLALNEIDEARLFEILGDLERLSDGPFARLKGELDLALASHYGVPTEELRPWHYGDPFFQRPPSIGTVCLDPFYAGKNPEELATRTYDGIGLETRDILGRSDLYARPGKDQHAFQLTIGRGQDVRILCNLEPNERWVETLLHELGHAVYDKSLDPALPFLLRTPAHTLSTEAIAQLMGRLTLDEEWLTGVAGVSAAEVGDLGRRARDRQRLGMLIFVRWMLVMTHFERALYASTARQVSGREAGLDLDALWWDLVERYQLLKRPDGRAAPDWAAKIHLALYPAYYQNYMLGELMASQIDHYLRKECGGLVDRPTAGRLLKERIFARGALADWDKSIAWATGEPLNPRYFVEDFVAD